MFWFSAVTLNVTVEFVDEEFDDLLKDMTSTTSDTLKQKIIANVSCTEKLELFHTVRSYSDKQPGRLSDILD